METRIDHPEQVQPGWTPEGELAEHQSRLAKAAEIEKGPSPKARALASYQETAGRLEEVDETVRETKAAAKDARIEQDRVLDELAGYARAMGSDPLGLLKGRRSWTGRTRTSKPKP